MRRVRVHQWVDSSMKFIPPRDACIRSNFERFDSFPSSKATRIYCQVRMWHNVKRGMLSLYSSLNRASVTVAGTSILGSIRSRERAMWEDFSCIFGGSESRDAQGQSDINFPLCYRCFRFSSSIYLQSFYLSRTCTVRSLVYVLNHLAHLLDRPNPITRQPIKYKYGPGPFARWTVEKTRQVGPTHLLEPIYSTARRADGTAPVPKAGGCRLTLPAVKQQPHPPPFFPFLLLSLALPPFLYCWREERMKKIGDCCVRFL